MADPLATLLQLRQQSVDAERQLLVDTLGRQDIAAAAAVAARRAIARETDAALRSNGDRLVEAFAAWLPRAKATLASAEAAEETATAAVMRQRAAVATARARTRAVQSEINRQQGERLIAAARRSQAELDEIALRMHQSRPTLPEGPP